MDPRLKLHHPFTALICGPTSSGKTVLTFNLIKNYFEVTTISARIIKILYCYTTWQSAYQQQKRELAGIADIYYHKGLPDMDKVKGLSPHLIVIDDLMTEVTNDEEMVRLFTIYSHHYNISVMFISQNLFHRGRYSKDISNNIHYYFLLKNPRERAQIACLGRQMYPNNSKFLNEAYEDATQKPFSYLLIDVSPRCPDDLRIRTRILASESIKGLAEPIIYYPKTKKH